MSLNLELSAHLIIDAFDMQHDTLPLTKKVGAGIERSREQRGKRQGQGWHPNKTVNPNTSEERACVQNA